MEYFGELEEFTLSRIYFYFDNQFIGRNQIKIILDSIRDIKENEQYYSDSDSIDLIKRLLLIPNGSLIKIKCQESNNEWYGIFGVDKDYINDEDIPYIDFDPEITPYNSDYKLEDLWKCIKSELAFYIDYTTEKRETNILSYPTVGDIINYFSSDSNMYGGISPTNISTEFALSPEYISVQERKDIISRHSILNPVERQKLSDLPYEINVWYKSDSNRNFDFDNRTEHYPFYILKNSELHNEYRFNAIDTDLNAVIDFTLKIDNINNTIKYTVNNNSINAEEYILQLNNVKYKNREYIEIQLSFYTETIDHYLEKNTDGTISDKIVSTDSATNNARYDEDGSTIISYVRDGNTILLTPVYRTSSLSNCKLFTKNKDNIYILSHNDCVIQNTVNWGDTNGQYITSINLSNYLLRIDNSGSRVNSAAEVKNNLISNEIISTKNFDLFSINTPGFYFYHYGPEIGEQSMINAPSNVSGSFVMLVFPNGNEEPVQIMLMDTAKRVYTGYRDKNSKVISWIDVLDRSNAISAKEITDKADLFYYTTPGYYYKTENARYLKNIPNGIAGISYKLVYDDNDKLVYCSVNDESILYYSSDIEASDYIADKNYYYTHVSGDKSLFYKNTVNDGAWKYTDSTSSFDDSDIIDIKLYAQKTEEDENWTAPGFTLMILPVDSNVDRNKSENIYILIDTDGYIYTGHRNVTISSDEKGDDIISGSIDWNDKLSNTKTVSTSSGSGSSSSSSTDIAIITTLDKEVSELTRKTSDLESRTSTIELLDKDQDAKISSAIKAISSKTNTSDFNTLKGIVNTNTNNISSLDEKVSSNKTNIDDLTKRVDALSVTSGGSGSYDSKYTLTAKEISSSNGKITEYKEGPYIDLSNTDTFANNIFLANLNSISGSKPTLEFTDYQFIYIELPENAETSYFRKRFVFYIRNSNNFGFLLSKNNGTAYEIVSTKTVIKPGNRVESGTTSSTGIPYISVTNMNRPWIYQLICDIQVIPTPSLLSMDPTMFIEVNAIPLS